MRTLNQIEVAELFDELRAWAAAKVVARGTRAETLACAMYVANEFFQRSDLMDGEFWPLVEQARQVYARQRSA
jgi:hypothetical protein